MRRRRLTAASAPAPAQDRWATLISPRDGTAPLLWHEVVRPLPGPEGDRHVILLPKLLIYEALAFIGLTLVRLLLYYLNAGTAGNFVEWQFLLKVRHDL